MNLYNIYVNLYIYIYYSLRAKYGTSTRENAVHGSDSHETAARELAFFFPRFKVPWVPGTEPPIQRTLALIRPDCLAGHRGKTIIRVRVHNTKGKKYSETSII